MHDLNSLVLRRPEMSTQKRRNRSLGLYGFCDAGPPQFVADQGAFDVRYAPLLDHSSVRSHPALTGRGCLAWKHRRFSRVCRPRRSRR